MPRNRRAAMTKADHPFGLDPIEELSDPFKKRDGTRVTSPGE